ncbi:McrB family protein [Cellulophaga sp. BC115SP]|uniref:McrB family protein n=1 Tax=Cellulophaga sp. BC115SP TaxID=2683263 RepID=UPI00196B0D10|nr:AAA family ATPase [Cellulophaga sp. BC115SP]
MFRSEENDENLKMYYELIAELEKTQLLSNSREEQIQKYRYFTLPTNSNWKDSIVFYIEKIKPVINSFVSKYQLNNTFEVNEELFKKYIGVIENQRHSISILPNKSIDMAMPNSYPLNQILYGPPGTGKTYQTVALAYKIVHQLPLNQDIDYTAARAWYKQELAKNHDRQVEFITFHQNYSYEDFIAGIKPALNDDTLGFREHKGIFFEVCQRALKNLQQATQANYQEIPSFQEVFDTFIVDLIQNDRPVEVGLKRGGSFSITKVNAKNIEFKKQSGTSEHTLSIQTLEEIYSNQREFTSGLATYYNQIVDKLREIASGLTRSIPAQPLKNYVLIIDEINRANISRVFGELITLLEEDKRWGNDFETEVLLPDGFTKFTVPKNLYIIGTMNTADKSIALLDIALRRRFEFIPLYPDVSMVKDDYQVFFNTLNQIIKDKKGIDFCIGHAYFMPHQGRDFDFVKVMNQKVIPLLTEYFYNARTTQNDVKQLLEEAFRRSGLSFQIEENMFQIMIVGS